MRGHATFVDPSLDQVLSQIGMAGRGAGRPAGGTISAAADYLAPGAIEINRYATEIVDMVRRRFVLGQRINQTLATGQPHRYFEQLAIPTATATNPRALVATATQPVRQERVVALKAIVAQINYGLFDVEINQQQGQFAYLEAKDLTDTVDGVLKLHDQNLWNGTDTDLFLQTSTQYFGISGQILQGNASLAGLGIASIAATGSLVDGYKLAVANMANRQDFEVRPTAIYGNPTLCNLFDQEVYDAGRQLFYNQVEVLPGVVVNGIPTQVGILPLVSDPAINNVAAAGGLTQYTGFILSDVDMIKYAYLTDPLPRVFQLGLLGSLASQYVVVKFGAPYVEGNFYAHQAITAIR
jgi:hypothetical protein